MRNENNDSLILILIDAKSFETQPIICIIMNGWILNNVFHLEISILVVSDIAYRISFVSIWLQSDGNVMICTMIQLSVFKLPLEE